MEALSRACSACTAGLGGIGSNNVWCWLPGACTPVNVGRPCGLACIGVTRSEAPGVQKFMLEKGLTRVLGMTTDWAFRANTASL